MIINMNGAKAPETPSPTLQEKTVTPETLPTVIGADEGYDGLSQVTVNPDSQLKAENIRSGKSIFGVQGAFVGEPQTVYETVDTARWCYLNNATLTGLARAFFDVTNVVKTAADYQNLYYWSGIHGSRFMYKGKLTFLQGTTYSKSSYSTGYGTRWTITADSMQVNAIEIYTYADNEVTYPKDTAFNITIKGYPNGSTKASYACGRSYGFDMLEYTTTAKLAYATNATKGFIGLKFILDEPWVLNNLNFIYNTTSDAADSDVSLGFTVYNCIADVIE